MSKPRKRKRPRKPRPVAVTYELLPVESPDGIVRLRWTGRTTESKPAPDPREADRGRKVG